MLHWKSLQTGVIYKILSGFSLFFLVFHLYISLLNLGTSETVFFKFYLFIYIYNHILLNHIHYIT